MIIDLGDADLIVKLRIKGLRRYRVKIHVGAPMETTEDDRIINSPTHPFTFGKTGIIMDLQADKKVALSTEWTDELDNPVPAPADATSVYTVDDPTIITLTDNGDGTAVAAATGTLGTANVHLVATSAGAEFTGDLQIVVVAGLAERVSIVAGEPEEITPDV